MLRLTDLQPAPSIPSNQPHWLSIIAFLFSKTTDIPISGPHPRPLSRAEKHRTGEERTPMGELDAPSTPAASDVLCRQRREWGQGVMAGRVATFSYRKLSIETPVANRLY